MAVLRTERLRLRSWRSTDVEVYAEACNTPAVMRWLGGVQTQAAVAREVRYFDKAEVRDGFTFWVVEHAGSKRLLGFCGLLRISERDCPLRNEVEVGWRIRESAWRQGFAFEAASAVLDYAFQRLQLSLVVSRAARGNVPSRELMAKLGMMRRSQFDYRPSGENGKLAAFTIAAAQWRHARLSHLK